MHPALHPRNDLEDVTRACVVIDGRELVILAAWNERAQQACAAICERWGLVDDVGPDADVVALGGDGFVLRACHAVETEERRARVYGLNFGTVGFLTNEVADDAQLADTLGERLVAARSVSLAPLRVLVERLDGSTDRYVAFNDVSVLRSTPQAAHLRVSVETGEGALVIEKLVGDGLIVSVPAGSTGYTRSAGGVVLPMGSDALQLVALAPYDPAWRGAVLPASSVVAVEILSSMYRRVLCSVDHLDVGDAVAFKAFVDDSASVELLFDPGHVLDTRVLAAQFPSG